LTSSDDYDFRTDLVRRERFPADPAGGPFATVVIDPPWRYGDRLPGPGRGAEKHYPTLSQNELLWMTRLVDFNLATNAHVYIWTTNSFVPEAYELMEWFDAEHKTNITWVKVKNGHVAYDREVEAYALDQSDVRMGMGHYWRGAAEHCLFGVRGRLPAKVHNLTNVVVSEQGKHSQKPRVFYDLVEQMSPGPYLEIFARDQGRLGWTAWGNEVSQ